MATSTSVQKTGNGRVDGVLSGWSWAGTRIAYSFPDAAGDYGGGYLSDADGDGRSAQVDGFSRLSTAQVASARFALDVTTRAAAGFSVEGFTNLRIDHAGLGSGAATGYRFEKWGAPQTYMMLDIAALQAMYGADYSTNAGDTVYRWTPGSGRTLVNGAVAIDPGGDRIFATVWDGGGRDTYDLSAYETAVTVDLRPGQHSVFAKGQLADLGGGPNGGHARGNVFNALLHHDDPRSLIEGAIGGSGNDRLTGNQAANVLRGSGGADRLDGLTGNDFLDGGSGHDRLFGGPGADKLYGRADNDVLVGGCGADLLAGGAGADCFVFRGVADSPCGHGDRVVASGGPAFDAPGRAFGDRVDVSAIDADAAAAGNQAFAFGGKARGHLWLAEKGAATMVYANLDGDAAPEFELAIHDGTVRSWAYTAHDFIL